MKLTKTAATKKAKQAGFDLKVDKKAKTIEVTRKKKTESVESTKDHTELMSTVKSMMTQNKDLMTMLSSLMTTEQAVKSIAEIVEGFRGMDKPDNSEVVQMQAQRGKILRGKVNTRDSDGFIETFTIKVEPERIN